MVAVLQNQKIKTVVHDMFRQDWKLGETPTAVNKLGCTEGLVYCITACYVSVLLAGLQQRRIALRDLRSNRTMPTPLRLPTPRLPVWTSLTQARALRGTPSDDIPREDSEHS